MSNNQSATSTAFNAKYFLENYEKYHNSISSIDTYKNLHTLITSKVRGTDKLLDIGNGGIFNYDTESIKSITAIDLFLDDVPNHILKEYFPSQCKIIAGSALELPEPDGKFDTVLVVMLLHHLTGKNVPISLMNAKLALNEGLRVLKPGGRLIVVESGVSNFVYELEKIIFAIVSKFFTSILKVSLEELCLGKFCK
jgi:ubiquinone/menaquinone biosynthesis C-methylase UbiE